jgi:hypothetical protein
MPMSDFFRTFPKLAESELRNFTIGPGTGSDDLPAGRYGFIDAYCDEKGCDCRRVVIAVFSEEAITQIRYSVERNRPAAIAMAEQIQTEIAAQAFRPEALAFASSWFEDDARIEDLLHEHIGAAGRWLEHLPQAAGIILQGLLEQQRDIWTERSVQSARRRSFRQ